jgi:cytochrome P450
MPSTAASVARDLPLPPGRLGLPYVGETVPFLRDPYAFFDKRYRAHGPVFKTRVLGDDVLCFVGPEAFSFFTDERYFTRADSTPPHIRALFHPDAAPFLDGPRQKQRRHLIMQAFTPDALAGYQPIVERITGRYLARWAAAGGAIRGVDEIGALCFAIAASLFTGADPDRDDRELAAVFDALIAGILAAPIDLPLTTYRRALAARDRLRAFVAAAVAGYEPGTGQHALERLVAARDPHGNALTRDEIEIETLHFYLAAYGALQGALCQLVIALASHPDVMRRARDEARAIVPTGALGDGVARLRYIDQTCREVRRRYRVVPTTFFATVRADCEFGGMRVPAGWKAVAALHTAMQDPAVFRDPDRFDPDRFAPERAEHTARPNSYVPHGGGPVDGHRCAGEALADRLLVTFAALALRGYTWELPPQDLSAKSGGLVALPRSGLNVILRRV